MNYPQTLAYLFAQLPMFHRIGAAAYKADLHNTYAICEVLDHPEKKFRSIHIAGTNGKGSTSHMLAAILQCAGYKTGLYTSPHLVDFRERIRINGTMIPEQEVIRFVEKYKADFEKIQPSFFEWTVGLAFDYFTRQKVEIAVIETGLGGRLDSTNVIVPELSVITNIGWDHTNLLGDTLQKIAKEKAGIIKTGVPVVIGEVQEEVASIFTDKGQEVSAPVVFAPLNFKAVPVQREGNKVQVVDIMHRGQLFLGKLKMGLTGNYQLKNILTVIQSVVQLRAAGFVISDEHLREGVEYVQRINGLMGRWQQVKASPLTLCDVAHNKEGIQEVVAQLKQTPYEHLHIVLGMVNDKDIDSVLTLLPAEASYYFCKADIPRALNADELASHASGRGLNGSAYASVAAAYAAATLEANEKDMIFIGGSTFVVADFLRDLSV